METLITYIKTSKLTSSITSTFTSKLTGSITNYLIIFNVCILNISILLLLKYMVHIYNKLNERIIEVEKEKNEILKLKENLKIKIDLYQKNIISKINEMKNIFNVYFDFNKNLFENQNESIIKLINESSLTFHEYELNELVDMINNYFIFFKNLNIDKKIFHSLFYIPDEVKYNLLLFSNNDYVMNNILHKYFEHHYDERNESFFPLPIKLLNKNFQLKNIDYFSKFLNLNSYDEKHSIEHIINMIKEEKTNFIDLLSFSDKIFISEKVKLLNEKDIEYDIKIMKKIKEYFDMLHLIYQKYEYLNVHIDK